MSDEDSNPGPTALARPESEAIRLKTLAEQNYTSNDLKSAAKHAKWAHKLHPTLDGLSELLTAFRILRAASEKPISAATPDYYAVLEVEPFSNINTIKKQYRKLALTLHPDKNPFAASEEAFKLVGEAMRVFSDKIRRKEYDMRVRIGMQSRTAEGEVGLGAEETFWTACSICRLLHQFERRYLGHSLMCPSCKKSFKAVEVEGDVDNEGDRVAKDGNLGDGDEDEDEDGGVLLKDLMLKRVKKVRKLVDVNRSGDTGNRDGDIIDELRSRRDIGNRDGDEEEEKSGGVEIVESERAKRAKTREQESKMTLAQLQIKERDEVEIVESGRAKRAKTREEETMTLFQMQNLAKKNKKKVDEGKLKVKSKDVNIEKLNEMENEKDEIEEEKESEKDEENEKEMEKEVVVNMREKRNRRKVSRYMDLEEVERTSRKRILLVEKEKENGMEDVREKRERRRVSKYGNSETTKRKRLENHVDSEIKRLLANKKGNLEIMPVEDSDFHDFDKDRRERSFKKGQVWAVYDDDDGMPRHYALIDEIVKFNPFQVTLSWLQFHTFDDELLTSRQKTGSQVFSCGRFKVSRKVSVKYLNLFSHVVGCERAAREVYRIYPTKGSIWAMYSDDNNKKVGDKRCYDVVVSLSGYSDMYGLSVARLEKVDGFRTVFKRKEVGVNGVVWLGKNDVKLFSHQIPAKKLTGEEAEGLPKDCWELDPASFTPQLLIGS